MRDGPIPGLPRQPRATLLAAGNGLLARRGQGLQEGISFSARRSAYHAAGVLRAEQCMQFDMWSLVASLIWSTTTRPSQSARHAPSPSVAIGFGRMYADRVSERVHGRIPAMTIADTSTSPANAGVH
jgi:hypothetical protein